ENATDCVLSPEDEPKLPPDICELLPRAAALLPGTIPEPPDILLRERLLLLLPDKPPMPLPDSPPPPRPEFPLRLLLPRPVPEVPPVPPWPDNAPRNTSAKCVAWALRR